MRRTRKTWAPGADDRRLKIALCDYVARSMADTRLSQRVLAARMGASQANLSRVNLLRVEQLTFNQLFRYLLALEPYARLMITRI